MARRKCQRASRRSLNFCLRHQQPTSHQLTGTYLPIVVAMPYRKGKRQLSAQPKSRRNLKQRRKDASLSQLMNSTQSPDSNCTRRLPLRDREAHGMIPVSEEQIRTYIAVAFALRFDEPAKEEWSSAKKILCQEVGVTERTVLKIFGRAHATARSPVGRRKNNNERLQRRRSTPYV